MKSATISSPQQTKLYRSIDVQIPVFPFFFIDIVVLYPNIILIFFRRSLCEISSKAYHKKHEFSHYHFMTVALLCSFDSPTIPLLTQDYLFPYRHTTFGCRTNNRNQENLALTFRPA